MPSSEDAKSSWPPKAQLKGEVKFYTGLQQEMSVNEVLLLRDTRIVIPSTMRAVSGQIAQRTPGSREDTRKSQRISRGSVLKLKSWS